MTGTIPGPTTTEKRETINRLVELLNTASAAVGRDTIAAGKMDGLAARLVNIAANLPEDPSTETGGAATRTTGTTNPDVARKVFENRVANGFDPITPFDQTAPIATQRRQIRAYNALMERAVPGRDRICGVEEESYNDAAVSSGPCVLREGHHKPQYDDQFPRHMDASQAARAERYLVHSHPDTARRA
jgi:hypothetical protein